MTLQGSQRRGFRRRMLQAGGNGGQETPPAEPQPRPDRATPYSKEARPENHPALATWLPTRSLHLVAACLGVLLPITAVIAAAATVDRWLPTPADAGRWSHAVTQIRDCLDVSPRTGLAAWMGQGSLVAAACIAVSIRQMRRYRLDDYQGRYRAWGWLAALAVVATLERQLPLSELVSATIANASGLVLGPRALGWWLCLAAPACLAAGLWAVMPMHERLATGLALVATAVAWVAATGCGWLGGDDAGRKLELISGSLTLAGDGLLAVSMLIAARSVLREVRGEAAKPARQAKAEPRRTDSRGTGRAETREEPTPAQPAESLTAWSDGSDLDDEDGDAWGEDDATRKLSKAERKRLRKLGRMNRAA
jgi:hypothetical protein